MTFSADGNLSWEDESDIGAFAPEVPDSESDQREAGERSGGSRATFLTVGFGFVEGGALTSISRHRGTVKFDGTFESFSLEGFAGLFFDPGANALEDEPAVSLPFAASARRIPAKLR